VSGGKHHQLKVRCVYRQLSSNTDAFTAVTDALQSLQLTTLNSLNVNNTSHHP